MYDTASGDRVTDKDDNAKPWFPALKAGMTAEEKAKTLDDGGGKGKDAGCRRAGMTMEEETTPMDPVKPG